MNILIVDDEPIVLHGEERIIRAVISKAYPDEPVEIDLCLSAHEALQMIGDTQYELVFSDIEMPQMKGIEFCREIEKGLPDSNLFFVTGFSEYSLEAWDTYSCGYLMKPLTEEQVLAALKRVRHPLMLHEEKLKISCIGAFELSYHGQYITFARKKSLEMMAVLVDRMGSETSIEKIRVYLWDEGEDTYEKNAYLRQLASDIRKTLSAVGLEDVLINTTGGYRLNKDKVSCDYYDWLRNGNSGKPDPYMIQFDWAQEGF